MFDWLIEIDAPKYSESNIDENFHIKKIPTVSSTPNISPICQLFSGMDVILKEDVYTSFPITNDVTLNIVKNELTPHYKDVKQVFINNELHEIFMIDLKEESKQTLKELLTNGIYPVVPDLYRSCSFNRIVGRRTLKYYSVLFDCIDPMFLKETQEIAYFLKHSFFEKEDCISLVPTGWILEDSLKESITLRSFCTFANKIVLVVDESNQEVISLDIYG
ncbi:hypothetical protein VSY18_12625 [Bacillus albus]|uniref:hypothetical protein n=1 Tax=Bacillus cereus group TaxID=86661 RepID=UPI0022E253FF|nr:MULTISPECIES: hypothetical protein [Bacillus cereus group]MDA2025980.1 hypothetical protein [Bacillus cereus group sp. Bcc03]MDA2215758.1 hypothetical protein [Bacillus cereus group sp. Bc228]MDA2225866.1 hypothetical protein [Bacillus cereus group sp. Bc227]MDA2260084.1 hypothetical protein [Bacillus cereus group sp. Bc200]MDA2320202.1 hypothetical protein [Bacillus cereus group sp. Bc177]